MLHHIATHVTIVNFYAYFMIKTLKGVYLTQEAFEKDLEERIDYFLEKFIK